MNTIAKQANYIKSHGVLLPNNQVFLTKPLFVFKKVLCLKSENIFNNPYPSLSLLEDEIKTQAKRNVHYTMEGIANLIIPVGSIVNPPVTNELKIRANRAICYSIAGRYNKQQKTVGVSKYDNSFVYRSALENRPSSIKTYMKSYLKDYGLGYPNSESYPSNPDMADYTIYPNKFNTNRTECRHGIHFFLKLKDALSY